LGSSKIISEYQSVSELANNDNLLILITILRTVLEGDEENGVEEKRIAKMRKYLTRYQSECIRDNESIPIQLLC